MEADPDLIQICLLVGVSVLSLLILWVAYCLFGRVMWFTKFMFKMGMCALLWGVVSMLLWNFTQTYLIEPQAAELSNCGSTNCETKAPKPPEELSGFAWLFRSRIPKPPPEPDIKPEPQNKLISVLASSEIRNLAKLTSSIWRGDMRGFSAWSIAGSVVWGTYRITSEGIIYGLKTMASKVFPVTHSAETKIWSHSVSKKGLKTCGVSCAISGTDCAGDSACLCEWKNVKKDGKGTGFSTIWEPCRDRNTAFPVGLCLCPQETG